MRVQFSFVGMSEVMDDVWMDLEQIPREGDCIYFPKSGEISVRSVVWFPTHNDEDEELPEPLVYVVVGRSHSESPPSAFDRYLKGDDKPLI